MRRILSILGLLTNLTVFLNAQIIVNPGFEISDHQSSTLAEAWNTKDQKAVFTIDSIVRFSGKNSMRISLEEVASVSFSQSLKLETKQFQKYRLSSWIKQDTSINEGGLVIKLSTVHKNTGNYIMDNQSVSTSGEWQKYICDFYLDGTQDELNIIAYMYGKDTVWFDDFDLELVRDSSNCTQTAKDYIEEAISIVEENSIMIDSIDFPAIKKTCLNNMFGLESESDCYPMIWYILNKLGDNHSFLMPTEIAEDYASNDELEQATGMIIDKKYAYVNIPGVGTTDSLSISDFATKLQKLIGELDSVSPIGWIVDLRKNFGGNCWPMLAGLGPLIGEGECCYLINSKDSSSVISYKQGISYLDESPCTAISSKSYIMKDEVPIAVLIGPRTASSGEIVAISFIGKSNSKLFGEPSRGMTTGNNSFKLSDGAFLVLTYAVDADRNWKRYGSKIQPDYFVNFSNESYDEDNDPVIKEAIRWINNKNN